MALNSAAHFIHEEYTFSVKKGKTLTAAIMHVQGRHVVVITRAVDIFLEILLES
jgi:DeoR/GlpR family transcriptional regulator of sugar metabolism